jgi:hypothetical protein
VIRFFKEYSEILQSGVIPYSREKSIHVSKELAAYLSRVTRGWRHQLPHKKTASFHKTTPRHMQQDIHLHPIASRTLDLNRRTKKTKRAVTAGCFALVSYSAYCSNQEDGSNIFVGNVGWLSTRYMALYPRRWHAWLPQVWQPQIPRIIYTDFCPVVTAPAPAVWYSVRHFTRATTCYGACSFLSNQNACHSSLKKTKLRDQRSIPDATRFPEK